MYQEEEAKFTECVPSSQKNANYDKICVSTHVLYLKLYPKHIIYGIRFDYFVYEIILECF